jgi:hypothetical protein
MIGPLVHHPLPEHVSYQSGNARVLLGGLYSCPSGDFFIHGNGNVFHNTILVQHEICVKRSKKERRGQLSFATTPSGNREGDQGFDPEDSVSQSALGEPANSRRIAETWDGHLGADCRPAHAEKKETAITDLARIPGQSS